MKISKGAINFLKNQKEKLSGVFVPNHQVVDQTPMHVSSIESLRPQETAPTPDNYALDTQDEEAAADLGSVLHDMNFEASFGAGRSSRNTEIVVSGPSAGDAPIDAGINTTIPLADLRRKINRSSAMRKNDRNVLVVPKNMIKTTTVGRGASN